MIKRFDWPPARPADSPDELSSVSERINAGANKTLENIRTIITQRPEVALPVAVCMGVALGWIINRR